MQLAVCEFARNELGWEGDVPTILLWFVNVWKEVTHLFVFPVPSRRQLHGV